MVLIKLKGTGNSLKFLDEEDDPHFLLRIKGRTKGFLILGKGFKSLAWWLLVYWAYDLEGG